MHGLRVHVEIYIFEYFRQLTFPIPPYHHTVSIIQPGEIYLKEGRNTGVTVGICNGVELYLPKDIRHVYETEEPPTSKFPGSKELVIIPSDGLTLSYCKLGDSGSLVYDIYGRICGLLYRQLDDKLGMAPGLATTFSSILHAIERKGVS